MWDCIWSFLTRNLEWFSPLLIPISLGLYRTFYPAQISLISAMRIIEDVDVPYLGGDSCMRFSVEMKVHPRANNTIDDFSLELKLKSGEKFSVEPRYSSELKKGARLVKGEDIGPFWMEFEITDKQLGLLGTETLEQKKEFFRGAKMWVVLKVRHRNRWPIREMGFTRD